MKVTQRAAADAECIMFGELAAIGLNGERSNGHPGYRISDGFY